MPLKRIVDAGAQFRSLAEPWADTGSSTGRLMTAVLYRAVSEICTPIMVIDF